MKCINWLLLAGQRISPPLEFQFRQSPMIYNIIARVWLTRTHSRATIRGLGWLTYGYQPPAAGCDDSQDARDFPRALVSTRDALHRRLRNNTRRRRRIIRVSTQVEKGKSRVKSLYEQCDVFCIPPSLRTHSFLTSIFYQYFIIFFISIFYINIFNINIILSYFFDKF